MSNAALGRVPVLVDSQIYQQYKQYSRKVGSSVSNTIREALKDWFETVATAREEMLNAPDCSSANLLSQKVSNLIEFPVPKQLQA